MATFTDTVHQTVYDDRWEPIGYVAVDITNDATVHYRWECTHGCRSISDETFRWMAYADCYHHHYTIHEFHDKPLYQWGTEEWISAAGLPMIRGAHE